MGGSLASGMLGNMSEVSVEDLTKEYGAYLMEGETIQTGFRLVRDVLLFTDKRIIDFDKQGATGQKMRVDSINLSSVIHVSAETSGFGLDDSEINISYICALIVSYIGTLVQEKGEKTWPPLNSFPPAPGDAKSMLAPHLMENVSTVLSLPILRRKRSMPPWSGSSTTGKYLGTLLI